MPKLYPMVSIAGILFVMEEYPECLLLCPDAKWATEEIIASYKGDVLVACVAWLRVCCVVA